MPLLSFECVSKSYPDGRRRIVVLEQASFAVHEGDFVGILGARRTGKSTLLRLAAGIESPDKGTIDFGGRDLARISALERGRVLTEQIQRRDPGRDCEHDQENPCLPIVQHAGR